jgi:predicted GIY-YIG superfamily endonuclease
MNDRISVGQAGLNGRRHALYRFFDASDVLLYVGITVDIGPRFKKHGSDKPWWGSVDRIEIEHFATRGDASAAERKAIKEEHPLHNVVHNLFVAAPDESTENNLACDIVYGMVGIDHGSDEHLKLIERAREGAQEDEREFGDPDVEVARILVSELIDKGWEEHYGISTLIAAVPRKDMERHRSLAEATMRDYGLIDFGSDEIHREVIRRLAAEVAWMHLNRLDLEKRQYFLSLAQQHNLDHCGLPAQAIKYYQHYLDGDLDQVLEREGRD